MRPSGRDTRLCLDQPRQHDVARLFSTVPYNDVSLGGVIKSQCEICSARSRVFGPKPNREHHHAIAPAIKINTPVVPNAFNTPAMKNDVKMAEKREYTKPARARMLVGKSSV
jgi:hypothetical protein